MAATAIVSDIQYVDSDFSEHNIEKVWDSILYRVVEHLNAIKGDKLALYLIQAIPYLEGGIYKYRIELRMAATGNVVNLRP